MNYELILGSQSPRRRELLGRMGLPFRVLTAEIDETKYETEDPEDSVRRICLAKARAVAEAFLRERRQSGEAADEGPALILASDTVVVLDGKILGKPRSAREAAEMLRALSGREHTVCTAFTLLPCGALSPADGSDAAGPGGRGEAKPFTRCEKTLVRFRRLSEAEIEAYVATGEPMDKAGAYGIQGKGAMLVEEIRGDYFTVMGLPVCRLYEALKTFGIDALKG